jgi:Ring finger domain
VSLQLLLDVFRNDILRFLLRCESSGDQRQPARVILYNVTYLIYALMVMKMGVTSVYMGGETVDCQQTAPELFKASQVFVTLSLTVWVVFFAGYLLPFTAVAVLLTWNGYHPTHTNFPVFPATNTVSASDAVDHLQVIRMPEGNCCICLEDFNSSGAVVETACLHRFHRSCCREWLRQAKTCPVCREPIVKASNTNNEEGVSQHEHDQQRRGR